MATDRSPPLPRPLTPRPSDLWQKGWALGDAVVSAAFSTDGKTAAIAVMDGTALLIREEAEGRATLHPGASPLSFVAAGSGFLSGGEDGRVVRVGWETPPHLLAHHPGKWVDHVAAHPKGTYAYAVGKDVRTGRWDAPQDQQKKPFIFSHPSSIGGLAFHPKGVRLAVGHYNGVSLWWMNTAEMKPDILTWKGSHLGVIWHPDATYILSSMQENALHGWRLKDRAELRMAGYPGKVHSFSFSASGRWLATSGSEQIIVWPFSGGGPQGKPPLGLGMPENQPCTVVACNPCEELVAAGYGTGRIVLALFENQLPVELLSPDNVAVVALAWSPDGKTLLAGREDGTAYLFTVARIIEKSPVRR